MMTTTGRALDGHKRSGMLGTNLSSRVGPLRTELLKAGTTPTTEAERLRFLHFQQMMIRWEEVMGLMQLSMKRQAVHTTPRQQGTALTDGTYPRQMRLSTRRLRH